MSDDISKKISIEVELQSEKLQQNIQNLNGLIDKLKENQKALSKTSDDSTAAFKKMSSAISKYQAQVKAAGKQLTTLSSAIKSSTGAANKTATAISKLANANTELGKSLTSGTALLQKFSEGVSAAATTTQKQHAAVEKTGKTVAAHGKNMKDGAAAATQMKKALDDSAKTMKDVDLATSRSKSSIDAHNKSATESSAKSSQLKKGVDASAKSLKDHEKVTKTSKKAVDEHSHSMSGTSGKAKQLQAGLTSSATGFQKQETHASNSKKALDLHKQTVQLLQTEFKKLEGVSGELGPILEAGAKGFDFLKKGLDIARGGFEGIGTAIKTSGFGWLLQIVQYVIEYFSKTTEGSKILQGALSAIGVIVDSVKNAFNFFKTAILDAITHPIESIKAFGKMIMDNIVNRFKAFSIILDGIIHLDFKKMANGALQAFTGVTDGVDKIGSAFNKVKEGVKETANKMAEAYKDGYTQAGEHVKNHEDVVNRSVDRQKKKYKELKDAIVDAHNSSCDCETKSDSQAGKATNRDNTQLTSQSMGIAPVNLSQTTPTTLPAVTLAQTNNEEQQKLTIKQSFLKKFEGLAKQSAGKIEAEGFKLLSDSIKKQADAKVAALEQDKQAVLSNSNLTSAQRLAIEQQFKKKEGQIKAKAFKEEQEASIAQALINGAIAVTKVTAQDGIGAAFGIAAVVAETAAQIAKIASQKPPAYAAGGLHYDSDGKGGVLPGYSKTDNTNAWLRSGEGVVVSEAMRVPWARNLVSAINVGFGGRDFSMPNPGRGYAVGGIFTDGGDANRYYNQPVHDQKNLANSIAYQMINNFPPVYVDVKDINNQQNILAQTINRVTL